MARVPARSNEREVGFEVLIHTGAPADAGVIESTLSRAGFATKICPELDAVCAGIRAGGGAAVLTDDTVLRPADAELLCRALDEQPEWSDFPLMVLTHADRRRQSSRMLFDTFRDVASLVLLERPLNRAMLISSIRSAMRSRFRQFQVADELRGRRDAEAALRELNRELERKVEDRTFELSRQAKRLRQLAEELTRAEDRVRQQLAQDLHDGLQQILVGMQLRLKNLEPPDADGLARLRELLAEAMHESRGMIEELTPPLVRDADLGESLGWLTEWFERRFAFSVDTDVDPNLPDVEETVRIFIFKAVRELLFNALKHSGRNEAFVRVDPDNADGFVRVVVHDEGDGFDAASLADSVELPGLGLFSLRERLNFTGGELKVDSIPGDGTRVTLTVPAREAARGENEA